MPIAPFRWRDLAVEQQPPWPDLDELHRVAKVLETYPPLVLEEEAAALRSRLAAAAEGRAFLLQIGDCAESFDDVTTHKLDQKFHVYSSLATELERLLGVPTELVGRVAGQFAKPRTSPVERRGSTELPSFRGHNVNDVTFTARDRSPDPGRLLRGYLLAGLAANYLRASRAPMAISHEALILEYEDALLRRGVCGAVYAGSAHMLWVGERTRQPDGAHVAFVSGVANPIGCKCGPTMSPPEALEICRRLNPDNVPGRLTLVTRMGADRIGTILPPIVRAVRDAGHAVLWACDPMHGNRQLRGGCHPSRDFDEIVREVHAYVAVHHDAGTWPGGLHLECAAEAVTECIGGPDGIGYDDLDSNYTTLCDPRLNPRQAMELVRELARAMAAPRNRESAAGWRLPA